jgi:transposase
MWKKFYDEDLIKLAEEELASTKNAETYRQALAVFLPGRMGTSLEETALMMNCSRGAVTRLRRNFHKRKKEGYQSQKGKAGNNRNLTVEEEKEFIGKFLNQAKAGEIAVATQIKLEYEKLVEHKVPHSTIYRMLKRHGWRKIKPRKKHPQSDRKVQEAFKKNSLKPCSE